MARARTSYALSSASGLMLSSPKPEGFQFLNREWGIILNDQDISNLKLIDFLRIRNWFLDCAICWETALLCLFIYCPGLNTVLGLTPPSCKHQNIFEIFLFISFFLIVWSWIIPLPFGLYIFCYEELRKLIIRKWPNSFLGKELLV